jgi:(p)ppGpp synthase/HD superfamily hydrolase
MRKGTDIPYISHLLAVAALVLESGGDEDEAIAALLHDSAEDQGGTVTLENVRDRFGERVADIVAGCTDTFEDPKPDWYERKKAYLAHLPVAAASVRRVALADKLHNARCILDDFHAIGDRVWDRFSAGKERQLWYYRQLVKMFRRAGTDGMVQEFDRVVSELEQAARNSASRPT